MAEHLCFSSFIIPDHDIPRALWGEVRGPLGDYRMLACMDGMGRLLFSKGGRVSSFLFVCSCCSSPLFFPCSHLPCFIPRVHGDGVSRFMCARAVCSPFAIRTKQLYVCVDGRMGIHCAPSTTLGITTYCVRYPPTALAVCVG